MVFMEKIIAFILCLIALEAGAQNEQEAILQGNQLYKKQDYTKAAEQYEKARELNSKNNKALYNLGNAYYKSDKKEEAEKVYDEASNNTKAPLDKSKALYNKGVSQTRLKKLPESIDTYKQTLRLNPNDQQARENLQLALNEQKKQQQQKPKDEPKKQNEKSNEENKPQQEQNNSKLNKQQVEQMLNSLRQEEKHLQQMVQKKNNPGSSNAKDW